ncbi:amino acid ABC transporter substrate-binding protein [Arthrobacter gandavensis]|uniref:amino acid ABC transporter substrate-binding protein n=1 Tax=Arthrobacter gandavensis TaxID=169960 RepID=UPI00189017C7|nr:amino acid ABC transporter substrate-binding protein [Arthrobacter gandavensis]MBF4994779.1 amino acid ABC transporter substrate-binding protein [Arthrobacter gandavensis]
MRRLKTAAAASAALLLLAGCAPGTATSLDAIEDQGTIAIGTEGTYRPFSFHEEGVGELTGYDVEIAEAVAGKLGVDARFGEAPWDALFAGLNAGRFAMVANQVSITPERVDSYEFSDPYTVSPGVVVVPKGDTSITSFADLAGKTTAQSLSSNWYVLAQENGASVEAVEGWAQSVSLLEQGRVDATINDRLTFLDYLLQTPDAPIQVAAETDDPALMAFAFAKGNTELRDAVNAALKELRADGTLAEISNKYFGEDVSQ